MGNPLRPSADAPYARPERGGSLQRLAKLFCPSPKAGFDQFKGVRRAERVDITIKGGFEQTIALLIDGERPAGLTPPF